MVSQARKDLAYLEGAKRHGRKFSVLTCYDVATARLMEAAGVEVLLVGDTAGEVVLGLASTREIEPEFLIALTAAVRRGAPTSFVMADLPYLCRNGPIERTVQWCRCFQAETGCDAIKIEVTADQSALIGAVRGAGIPVVAHIGLLPQFIDPEVGYRACGRDAEGAIALIEAADRLEQAGASLLLLEAVASEVAQEITARASVPVIGCVAGPHCDGTVVVLHDMVALGGGHPPRATKQYANVAEIMTEAFRRYVDEIQMARFPVDRDAIHMKAGELEGLKARIGHVKTGH